jgi:uncharacterized protein YjbJ (UPF0337 family)
LAPSGLQKPQAARTVAKSFSIALVRQRAGKGMDLLCRPAGALLLSTLPERLNCPAVGKSISTQKEMTMDWNRVEGNWKQFKGAAKEKWGKLTDDDLNVIEGRREQLEGKLQQRYGFAKDQIHRDVDDWFKTLK